MRTDDDRPTRRAPRRRPTRVVDPARGARPRRRREAGRRRRPARHRSGHSTGPLPAAHALEGQANDPPRAGADATKTACGASGGEGESRRPAGMRTPPRWGTYPPPRPHRRGGRGHTPGPASPALTVSPAVHPPPPLKRAGRAWHGVQGCGNGEGVAPLSGTGWARRRPATRRRDPRATPRPRLPRASGGLAHEREPPPPRRRVLSAAATAPTVSASGRNANASIRGTHCFRAPSPPPPAPDPFPSRARTHTDARRQRPHSPPPYPPPSGGAYGTVAGRAAATAAS